MIFCDNIPFGVAFLFRSGFKITVKMYLNVLFTPRKTYTPIWEAGKLTGKSQGFTFLLY